MNILQLFEEELINYKHEKILKYYILIKDLKIVNSEHEIFNEYFIDILKLDNDELVLETRDYGIYYKLYIHHDQNWIDYGRDIAVLSIEKFEKLGVHYYIGTEKQFEYELNKLK